MIRFQCASCGSLKGENVLALGGPNSARSFIRCVECRTEDPPVALSEREPVEGKEEK